jgi:hypothetical protein
VELNEKYVRTAEDRVGEIEKTFLHNSLNRQIWTNFGHLKMRSLVVSVGQKLFFLLNALKQNFRFFRTIDSNGHFGM